MDEDYFKLINSYSCPIPMYEETRNKLIQWRNNNKQDKDKETIQ